NAFSPRFVPTARNALYAVSCASTHPGANAPARRTNNKRFIKCFPRCTNLSRFVQHQPAFFMKNAPAEPKPPLSPLPERLFGAGPAPWLKSKVLFSHGDTQPRWI